MARILIRNLTPQAIGAEEAGAAAAALDSARAYADSQLLNYQPRDGNLDAIAALTTQPFGRGLLTQSSDAGIVAAIQPALRGSSYTPVTYLNNWSAYSTSLCYKKFANGLIHLVGMSYKFSPTYAELLCKLPVDYAPPFFFHPPIAGLAPSWKSGLLGIDTNGEIRHYLSDNSGDSYLAINLVFGAA